MLVRMLLRFPTRSRLALPLGLRAPLAHSLRTYATPGRPKSVVGEPSRPVKRAVKKVAAKPRDGTSPAEKKVAAKKKAAAAKPVKKPKKKVLTPEQKQAQLLKKKTQADKQKALRLKTKDKSKLTDLKAAALDPPKQKAYPNTWSVFLAEEMKKVPAGEPIKLASFATETAASWKNLAPAELEHYNHLFHTSNEAQQANYTRWVESQSAEQIRLANIARAALRKKFPKQIGKWKDIQDTRSVKRPVNAYALFAINRNASGDFRNIKVPERAKMIATEWKALSEGEKEKYRKLQEQEKARYAEEHQRVYGHPPPEQRPAKASASAN